MSPSRVPVVSWVSAPPAKRRCIRCISTRLPPALSVLDVGVRNDLVIDDEQTALALGIVEERRKALYGSTLPLRLEIRFLPPHMMMFPTAATRRAQAEPRRTRSGLPEPETSLDTIIKRSLGLFRRRQAALPPRIRTTAEDGPRLGNLVPHNSMRYPTSYPEGCEEAGEPSLGMTILLSRALQTEEQLRRVLERELCIVAEFHCIGTQHVGPVFRLLARRAMLHEPDHLVASAEVDVSDAPRLQCINVRCGEISQPHSSDRSETTRRSCQSCGQTLISLSEGASSLRPALARRYGGILARLRTSCGFAALQACRALIWPAYPIWHSATPRDLALRAVAFCGVAFGGSLLLLIWASPTGINTFLGNRQHIKPMAMQRSQQVASANMAEELRRLKEKEGAYGPSSASETTDR